MSDLLRAAPLCRFTHACLFAVDGEGYCAYHGRLIELALTEARSEVESLAPAHLPPANSPAPARRDG